MCECIQHIIMCVIMCKTQEICEKTVKKCCFQ